jgi:general secretion pathway protein D
MSKPSSLFGAAVRVGILGAICLLVTLFHPAMSGLARPEGKVQTPVQVSIEPIRVSGISIKPSPTGQTVVEVGTSDHPTYHVTQLKHPSRLVLDVDGALKATRRRTYIAKSPLLYRVRVGQFRGENPMVVRVVLDLRGHPSYEVNALPAGIRVEIKRSRAESIVPVAAMKTEGEGINPPVQPASAPPPGTSMPVTPQGTSNPPAGVSPAGYPVSPNPQPAPSVFYVPSPFHALPQNEKLLDSLGLRVVLNFGYKTGKVGEAQWKTANAPGVEASRLFIKPLPGGSYGTIELALSPSPKGQDQVVIYGEQVEGGTAGPNPDVFGVQQIVGQEVSSMQQVPPPSDMLHMSYETYYLSYVKADRAMALLKTMGYTTVEYNEQAGESIYEKIYNPLKLGTGKPPIVIKLIDSTKTSIQEPAPTAVPAGAVVGPNASPPGQPGGQMAFAGASVTSVPQIGGTYLSDMTSGDPQERLLLVYDKSDPDSLQALINLLQDTVDVPSREVVIEALVIELNTDLTRQLGVAMFTQQSNQYTASSTGFNPAPGAPATPFIFTFDKNATSLAEFQAQLSALLQTNKAEILSNPSVLVLDDRQARIQIGQQVPVNQQLLNGLQSITAVTYFPVGIVLNLRPRISEDGTEITLQTEAIVSAINKAASAELPGTSVLSAPVIDNREVQSFVRVADNTPFIIGGLISTTDQNQTNGIPFLSQIPLLGNLFRNTTVTKNKQEVIIVVTPHVVPPEDKYFSYVIPKDSDDFDRRNYRLFRNTYRIRGNDIFNLEYVYDSNVYKQLVSRVKAASAIEPELGKTEPFSSVLKGGAPGEDVLVRRMLWTIIDRTHYARFVNPDKIIFFKNDPSAIGGAGFKLDFLTKELAKLKDGQNALSLTFEAEPKGTSERPLVPPKGVLNLRSVSAQSYPQTLLDGNDLNPDGTPRDWMVLLSKDKNYSGISAGDQVTPLELLQGVIVLNRLLELNKDLPLTLTDFHIGRQIIFPSQEELEGGYHLVDRDVAKLFYEVYNYYPVFEQKFDREAKEMSARLDKIVPQGSAQ